jgi:hypothetical protein
MDDGRLKRHIEDKPMTCQTLFTRFKNDVRAIIDGAFLLGHKRFVETLRGNLKHDLNLNWFDWVTGNTVRRRILV